MTVPAPPVTFNYANFIAEFPEMSGLSSQQAQGYFNRAQLFCADTICNPAFLADPTGGLLTSLLYLLTAHIAFLNAPRDSSGNISSTGSASTVPPVGMINSATEGSVSVGLDMGDVNAGSPSQAYFLQSRYGTEFWYGTAGFRTAFYVARPTIVPGAVYTGRRRFF